jgi:NADH-quinone oxidoreductase subunit J
VVPVTSIFFLLFAAVAVFGALMVVLQRNPVSSALFLVLSFCSLAGLYVLLHAPFLAAVQVIVYAGAIMVLFLFVIMLLNLQKDVDEGLHRAARRLFGWLLGLVLAAQLYLLLRAPWGLGPQGQEPPEAVNQVGNTQVVGVRLFTDYLLPFEITSIVLLVAIVGAVVLSLRKGGREGVEEAP